MTATDKFLKVGGLGTATTLSAPGYTAGGTSMNVGSTANYPTTTGFIVAVDEVQIVNGEEQRIDGSYNEYYAEVDTGTSFKNVVWVAGDNASKNYAAGATTRVYINVSSERDNRIIDGILAQHNQDGTHKNVTAASLTTTGNVTIGGTLTIANSTNTEGWNPLGVTPTLQSSNGQREFVLRYSGVDYTDRLQEGTKLKIPRTVTPGTQSTLLNGTNQYWSKTAPAGMTFTDDFACGAWVYLTSYPSVTTGSIIGRFNGTSGWRMEVSPTGQIGLYGINGAPANYSGVKSASSVPLFRWIYISGQLDMSAFTASSTTSYLMFDGVSVPATVSRGGTNPTSLAQAGDLQVGASNSTLYFPGYIKNAWVSSAKVPQANIQQFMNADLSPAVCTANNIISAFNFNGNGNDVNTTNANNLTGQNGAVATSTNINFKPNEYAIATKATYTGGNTDVTVFCPQGAGIPNETLGATSYSSARAPYGFPADSSKWSVQLLSKVAADVAGPTAGTVYNPSGLALTVPTGAWNLKYKVQLFVNRGTAPNCCGLFGLGIGSSSTPNYDTATQMYGSTSADFMATVSLPSYGITVGSATNVSLLVWTPNPGASFLSLRGDFPGGSSGTATDMVTAECGYL